MILALVLGKRIKLFYRFMFGCILEVTCYLGDRTHKESATVHSHSLSLVVVAGDSEDVSGGADEHRALLVHRGGHQVQDTGNLASEHSRAAVAKQLNHTNNVKLIRKHKALR